MVITIEYLEQEKVRLIGKRTEFLEAVNKELGMINGRIQQCQSLQEALRVMQAVDELENEEIKNEEEE